MEVLNNNKISNNGFKVSLVTVDSGVVQKSYELIDGQAINKNEKLWMSDGKLETLTLSGLSDFADLLKTIQSNQALILGEPVNRKKSNKLTTKEKWLQQGKPADTITRTKDALTWFDDQTYLLLLDYDSQLKNTGITPEEFWKRLTACVPELEGVGRVITSSTSSQIYNKETGECLRGNTGHHTSIIVKGDIEAFTELVKTRLWNGGEGFHFLGATNSQNGVSAAHSRTLIDLTVFSPERLVYEAGAKLGEGLEQRRPDPIVIEGEILNIDALPRPTKAEINAAREKEAQSKAEIQKLRVDSAVKHVIAKFDGNEKKAREYVNFEIKAVENQILKADHILYTHDGRQLKVSEINESHVDLQLKDPQEPDYNGGRTVAKIFQSKSGEIYICSFAHGLHRYTLDFYGVYSEECSTQKEVIQATNKESRKQKKAKRAVEYNETKGLIKNKPHIVLDQARLELPEIIKGINIISSPCKTGKTGAVARYQIEHTLRELFGRSITYRNALCHQTNKRNNYKHIQEFEHDVVAIAREKGISCCIDSAHLIDIKSVVEETMLVVDECDATLGHMLSGDTLGIEQERKLTHFVNLLKRVASLNGTIILMEDSVTDNCVDSWRKLIGEDVPYQIIENTRFISKWDITLGAGSVSGLVKRLLAVLAKQKRVMFGSDNQGLLENIERLIINNGLPYRVLRVDSKTASEPHVHEFLEYPNIVLERDHYDLVLYSPTAESGLSLETAGFDFVFGSFSHQTPRQIIQMLERYRLDVPRYIHCADALYDYETDWEVIRDQVAEQFNDTIRRSKLIQAFEKESQEIGLEPELHIGKANLRNVDRNELTILFNELYARKKAETNIAKNAIYLNLLNSLKDRGHSIREIKWDFDKDIQDELNQAQQDNKFDEACNRSTADENKYSLDESLKKLRTNSLSNEDRYCCEKRVLVEALPGFNLDDPYRMLYVTDKKKKVLKRVHAFVNMLFPELAVEADRKRLGAKLGESSFVIKHNAPTYTRVAHALGSLQDHLFKLISKEEYTKHDEDVVLFNAVLIQNKEQVKGLLNLEMETDVSPVKNVNKIVKFLQLGIKSRRPGKGNTRDYVYSIEVNEFWLEILESIVRKNQAAILESQSYQRASMVFDINKHYKKPSTRSLTKGIFEAISKGLTTQIENLQTEKILT